MLVAAAVGPRTRSAVKSGVETIDIVVIGAGVVGLAIGRALSLAGREVIVVDKADAIGTETSSRNSEVIHAGLYYGPTTLKARLCIRGRDQLYAYLLERRLPFERCGKLIVATNATEEHVLLGVEAAASLNGVALQTLSAVDVKRLEPDIACTRALLSPLSGIVDSHALMTQLQADLESEGGMVVLRTPVLSGVVAGDGVKLHLGGDDPSAIRARTVVNSAGLTAERVARSIAGIPRGAIPAVRFAKGNYFSCSPSPRFRHLIYPVPEPGGLGVHATLDLAGQVRFGPDVEWVDSLDCSVDPARADRFYGAIRRYWPALPDGALAPDYAGIRPKALCTDAEQDFRIDGPQVHGIEGLVNLFGIESPGLTAALAIGDYVADLVRQDR